ncbi:S-adenosyl-L-methionine-dependent methyltransferase [Rhizophagus clarus]|uniref:S-adenosyl-L-methionine-dependent methyltransferase n=1 Tax=Rhizophagus clarus TaxID=94130 RepID=A0A8H3R0A5_9GLOM|nr:S-adenosyl-L-methionine-dependent methyltransferase [Rhizophagus clarus]
MKDEPSNRNFNSSDPLKSADVDSILDSFRYFKGRRYHNLADVTYLLPNDDKEVERLNLQHNIFKFVWKNNFSSPVHELLKSGKAKILDVGCGTGYWLLDMAKEYPQALFLNLNDGIPFPNETFDFVIQRCLCNCVVYEKWEFYVKEMIRVAKHGGWLEFFEFSIDHNDQQLMKSVSSGFKAKGINSRPETCVPQFLEKCQELSKVHYENNYIPIGDRAGQLGAMMTTYISMNVETVKLLLTSAWELDDDEYDSRFEEAKLEFNTSKNYAQSFRWFSRKI